MKPQTLDLIRKALEICKESFDVDCNERAANYLLSAIRAETCGKTSTKFSIWDFCAKDPLRPVMNGILHDKGFKVASDAKLLMMLKEPYEESLEGKIIGRDGETIEGRYPRYEKVMPVYDEKEYTTHTIDFDSFFDQLKDIRAQVYQDCGKKKRWTDQMIVHIGQVYLSAERFECIIKFMMHVGTNEVYIKSPDRAVLTFAGESKAILMPRCITEDDVNKGEYYIIKL